MPQLDYYIFLSQLFWLGLFFGFLYLCVSEWILPDLYELFRLRNHLFVLKKGSGLKEEKFLPWNERWEFFFSSWSSSFPKQLEVFSTLRLKKRKK